MSAFRVKYYTRNLLQACALTVSFAPLSLLFLRDLDKVTNTWIPSKLGAKLTSRWIHPPPPPPPLIAPFRFSRNKLWGICIAFLLPPNDFQLEIYVLVYVKTVSQTFSILSKEICNKSFNLQSFEKDSFSSLFISFIANFFLLLLKLEQSSLIKELWNI